MCVVGVAGVRVRQWCLCDSGGCVMESLCVYSIVCVCVHVLMKVYCFVLWTDMLCMTLPGCAAQEPPGRRAGSWGGEAARAGARAQNVDLSGQL